MMELGKTFFNKIQEMKDEGSGSISMAQMDQIMSIFVDTLKAQVDNENELNIFNDIEKISQQLKFAQQELKDLNPKTIADDFIPGAASELTAVTEATEKSTNTILDAAESIQNLALKINDPEIVNQINEKTTLIFEACNFQDITGQRLNKVTKILEDIDSTVNSLIEATSGIASSKKKKEADVVAPTLMNGPQLEQFAPSQSDIDDLFKNS
ncbi:MAG: protein phosphatase CheZ [Alphaproteobacteria bacterium]